jgi:hypothetical protein
LLFFFSVQCLSSPLALFSGVSVKIADLLFLLL